LNPIPYTASINDRKPHLKLKITGVKPRYFSREPDARHEKGHDELSLFTTPPPPPPPPPTTTSLPLLPFNLVGSSLPFFVVFCEKIPFRCRGKGFFFAFSPSNTFSFQSFSPFPRIIVFFVPPFLGGFGFCSSLSFFCNYYCFTLLTSFFYFPLSISPPITQTDCYSPPPLVIMTPKPKDHPGPYRFVLTRGV